MLKTISRLSPSFLVHRSPELPSLRILSLAMATATASIRPVVLAGPSGCGKSTLINRLISDLGKDQIGFSVSHTTRKPRPNEQEGVHYHYVTADQFEQLVRDNAFVEFATFSGNQYGTSKKAVQAVVEAGKLCLLDIDMQGVKNVKHTDLKAVCIFVKPPDLVCLEQRLRGRGTETEEAIRKRLDAASAELLYAETPGIFDYVVINDDLDRAYAELKSIIEKVKNGTAGSL